ncbi:ABC transporter substrate-binding protein [Paenibacillus camerounensis]|uniref:ABC transporter substrate-binding protein n=1 Tax=Paenibacillus camerounensis TaxID=1243663 RepID=UPI0005A8288E|nr:ABC transporter substrate-binding protein [Paenibacillus camerounensis]
MFTSKKTVQLAVLIMMITAVLLAGCTKQNTGNEQAAAAEATPLTRMISTVKGEIEVPLTPDRVIVDWNIGHVLAVGVTPIGVPGSLLEYGEFLREPLQGVEDIGNHNEVSLEKIIGLNPDLIITWNQDAYEAYSKIAPTVVFNTADYSSMQEEVRAMGTILNREKEAEQWNESFGQRAAAASSKALAAVPPGATFTIADFNWLTNVGIVGNSSNRGGKAVYELLGLTPAPKVQEDLIAKGEESADVSSEVFDQYAGDYLLIMKTEGAANETIPEVWNGLDAVKNSRLYELDIHQYLSSDPYTSILQAEDIAGRLASGQTRLQ